MNSDEKRSEKWVLTIAMDSGATRVLSLEGNQDRNNAQALIRAFEDYLQDNKKDHYKAFTNSNFHMFVLDFTKTSFIDLVEINS